MKIRPFRPILLLLGLASSLPAAEQKSAATFPPLDPAAAGAPLVLPGVKQYDFVSRINGRPYRLMIWAPPDASPTRDYPIIYLLDGNEYFPAAATDAWHYKNAVIVGVGYATESVDEWRERRTFELTPSADPASKLPSGGGDAFTKVLLEEMKPFVESRYKARDGHRGLFGLSLGGLAVLHVMFHHPTAFDVFIAGSPAISWNGRFVLKSEEAFSAQVRSGNVRLKILITSAGSEQYRGTDPALLAAANRSRMIDNAAELAARLRVLRPQDVPVTYTVFPDETHGSGSYSALRRGMGLVINP